MRLHRGKKVSLILLVLVYGSSVLSLYLTDNLKVTRHELTRFYQTKMDSCVITRIDTIDYTGGRGSYQIFYTDCSTDFYPILSENGNKATFTINSRIIKEANSTEFRLLSEDKYYDSKMKHPDNEDDRGYGTKVALIFAGIVTALILVMPNSKFEKTGL